MAEVSPEAGDVVVLGSTVVMVLSVGTMKLLVVLVDDSADGASEIDEVSLCDLCGRTVCVALGE